MSDCKNTFTNECLVVLNPFIIIIPTEDVGRFVSAEGRVTPGSVCARPIRAQTRGMWAGQLLPLHPVPAAARFCSNSEVWLSELYRGALSCHSPNVFIKSWQRPCRSCQAPSARCVSHPQRRFWKLNVCFLHFGRLKLKQGEQGVWREREDFFFFLNRFAAGVAGVRLLSCTVRRHLYMLTDREERATLMLLLILLLAGYLWRGSPAVCSGVTCGRGNTASVEFTDLDSKRGHT